MTGSVGSHLTYLGNDEVGRQPAQTFYRVDCSGGGTSGGTGATGGGDGATGGFIGGDSGGFTGGGGLF